MKFSDFFVQRIQTEFIAKRDIPWRLPQHQFAVKIIGGVEIVGRNQGVRLSGLAKIILPRTSRL
ncbi:MAG: hypothetical protein LBU18_06390 [Treponema sp.]|jgi:hypothetical protein|nr:hypothetical protein [Treponema sp.]